VERGSSTSSTSEIRRMSTTHRTVDGIYCAANQVFCKKSGGQLASREMVWFTHQLCVDRLSCVLKRRGGKRNGRLDGGEMLGGGKALLVGVQKEIGTGAPVLLKETPWGGLNPVSAPREQKLPVTGRLTLIPPSTRAPTLV
jgi:hypothetical protein